MTTKQTRVRRAGGRVEEDSPVDGVPPRLAARRIDRTITANRVHACADECGTDEARATLLALWRSLRRGRATRRERTAGLDAAIAGTLEAAGGADADRWCLAEGAAWGLSWLARSHRGERSVAAGRHLERLVAEARRAGASLAERDTRAARFVIVLSRLFRDVEACRGLEASATGALAEEILRLVSVDGTVVLSGSAAVVDRVIRWSGVRVAARALGEPAWGDDVDRRWHAAAVAALRLLGGHGRSLAPAGHRACGDAALILEELATGGGGRSRRTAQLVRRGTAPKRRGGLVALDVHDAAAATAVVRTGWDRDGVRILLEYRDAAPRLEVACGDRLLVDGDWAWGVTSDGKPLEAEGAWTVSGWESDKAAAFLEIAAPLAGGMRLQRQVVVLRRSRIVLLADAVVPADAGLAGALAYHATLPVADGLDVEPASETREVVVYDGVTRFMVLPLALPEWRAAGGGGLTVKGGSLSLEQTGHGRLYAPLWLDCDPGRIGLPLTWRQLTVADTRRNLPPHQAAGFRVQAGDEQWLLYRALDAVRNRTLLGCNVSCEFLLGRVKRSGEVARTVEIE